MRWTVHIMAEKKVFSHPPVCIGDKIYCIDQLSYLDAESIVVHVLNTLTLRWASVKYCISRDAMLFDGYEAFVEVRTVAYGDKVYFWANLRLQNQSILLCFDTKTLKFSVPAVTGMQPNFKYGHSACIIKNKMYIFGGMIPRGDIKRYSQDVHCLDLDTMQWRFLDVHGTPPSPRAYHTAITYFDRMYICGGIDTVNSHHKCTEGICCSQVYYLDTISETWVFVNPIGTWPESRKNHCAWLYNDYMYIFGGISTHTVRYINSLYRYSIKGNFWECLNVHGVEPYDSIQVACPVYKDKVYFFGGERQVPSGFENETNMDLHVLDYSPTLKTLCILSVLEHNLDHSSLPHDIILDIRMMSSPNRNCRPK